jgi:RNA-binding protein
LRIRVLDDPSRDTLGAPSRSCRFGDETSGFVTVRAGLGFSAHRRYKAPMTAPDLTGKQRRHLRALGHGLRPVAQVGKEGLSEGLVAAIEQALADHELVKIKLGESAGVDRDTAAAELAARTDSAVAQILGNTILLYRPDPEEPRIALPARGP